MAGATNVKMSDDIDCTAADSGHMAANGSAEAIKTAYQLITARYRNSHD